MVSGLGLGWQPAFGIVVLLYFYSHYFFASGERQGEVRGGPRSALLLLLLRQHSPPPPRPRCSRPRHPSPAARLPAMHLTAPTPPPHHHPTPPPAGAAHIGAMYTAFLAVATACGTPAMLAAVALGQLSNLMGCLTTYGIGSAPPYFGAGYVPQVRLRPRRRLCSARRPCCSPACSPAAARRPLLEPAPRHLPPRPAAAQGDWLKFGFILSIWYLTVWLGAGGAWWKVIGLW